MVTNNTTKTRVKAENVRVEIGLDWNVAVKVGSALLPLQGALSIGAFSQPEWFTRLIDNDNFEIVIFNLTDNIDISVEAVKVNFTDPDSGIESNPFYLPIHMPSVTEGSENFEAERESAVYSNAHGASWSPERVMNQNLKGGKSYDMTIEVSAADDKGNKKVFGFYSQLVVTG